MANQSQIFVVSMEGRVLLMVDGPTPPEEDDLVIEARASLRSSGVRDEDVDVLWSRPQVAQGASL